MIDALSIVRAKLALYPDHGAADSSVRHVLSGEQLQAIAEALEPIGWLYESDDGVEFSNNHPVNSGECVYTRNIRAATAQALRDQLHASWEELRGKDCQITALKSIYKAQRERAERLNVAAGNVIARWDSPQWKWDQHTGVFIDELRAATQGRNT